MNRNVSCPGPTLLTPLLVLAPTPFISRPNSLETDLSHFFLIAGSGCRTSSLISIIFPVVSSNTAIAKCGGNRMVSPIVDSIDEKVLTRQGFFISPIFIELFISPMFLDILELAGISIFFILANSKVGKKVSGRKFGNFISGQVVSHRKGQIRVLFCIIIIIIF